VFHCMNNNDHSLGNSLHELDDDVFEQHLSVSCYGDFELTDAIRPSYSLDVRPLEGFDYRTYHDKKTHITSPIIIASASREKLWDLFMDLIEITGDEVDVVLEASHNCMAGHIDIHREGIDLPVLQSILIDHEELMLNDGNTGIAVLNPEKPTEVQFDDHKLLYIYGVGLDVAAEILNSRKVFYRKNMRFITQAEHIHLSSEEFEQQFHTLKQALGMEDSDSYDGY